MSTQSGLYGSQILSFPPSQLCGWQDDPFEGQPEPDLSSETSKNFWTRLRGNKTPYDVLTAGTLLGPSSLLAVFNTALINSSATMRISYPGAGLSLHDDLSAAIVKSQVQELRRHYALLSDDAQIGAAFEEVPVLFALLKDAVKPLIAAFGDERLFQLEALESDEGTILRVIVKLPHKIGNITDMMSKFNREWWLDNCARSKASLVFDYEFGDGF
jgi:hypothetical protein